MTSLIEIETHGPVRLIRLNAPLPLYCVVFGYGHSGRVRPGHGVVAGAVPTSVSGAVPFSTQFTTDVNGSIVLVDGPPAQCCAPGIMNSRANCCVRAWSNGVPPLATLSFSYQSTIASGENGPPLCGW